VAGRRSADSVDIQSHCQTIPLRTGCLIPDRWQMWSGWLVCFDQKTLGVSNEGAFPLLKILPTTTARRIRVRPKFSSFDARPSAKRLMTVREALTLPTG
jgi:hypothetical protein